MSTPNYTLSGVDIFGTEFTKNIDGKYIDRFKNIIACVNNFNNFLDLSNVQKLLTMDMNLPSTNISTEHIARILSDRSSITDCTMFVGMEPDFCKKTNKTGILTIPDVIPIPLTPDVNKNISDNILNFINNVNLQRNLLSKITSTDTTALDAHKEFMKDVCSEIFKAHYEQLFESRSNYILEGGLSVPQLTQDHITQIIPKFRTIIDSVSIDLDGFNVSKVNNYYFAVCEEISLFSRSQQNYVANPIFYNMFLNCFYPYIWFCYISGQIALIESGVSSDKAPRYFILRRFAVLFSYIFEFYTVMCIYANCSVSKKETAKSLIESINLCIAGELSIYNRDTYESLHSDSLANIESSKVLSNINRDIILSQNNLNKATINEKSIQSKYKNSYVFLWLWVAFLIVVVLSFSIFLYFFNSTPNIQYLYIAATVVVMAIFITLIIDMLN